MEVLSDLVKDSVSAFAPGGGGGLTDGDKGDIVVSGSGSILTLDENLKNYFIAMSVAL